jgi:aldose 1-epimerase
MSVEMVHLREPQTGAEAKVLASQGFNCFEYLAPIGGVPRDVLWAEPGFAEGSKRASGSGIPILFPFPGRIRGTEFEWEGRTYPQEAGDGRGNAIHGFVHVRPWRVIDRGPSRVVGQFQASLDDPLLANAWPGDFRVTVAYELVPGALRCEIEVQNPEPRQSLPCGLGLHPYFRVPPGGGPGGEWRVRLPVRQRWELAEMLAIGKRASVEDPEKFRSGLRFNEMKFDDVFTDLKFDGDRCSPALCSPDGRPVVKLCFDRTFRECVVYTPPHREAICIEPYTCVPDCFRLEPQGIDAGLRILPPGDSFGATVEIRVDDARPSA